MLSRSTQRRDLGDKRAFYMDNGIAQYWMIDRDTRAVIRATRAGEERIAGILKWVPPNSRATLLVDVGAMFQEILTQGRQ